MNARQCERQFRRIVRIGLTGPRPRRIVDFIDISQVLVIEWLRLQVFGDALEEIE
jgi:hypothetical protein